MIRTKDDVIEEFEKVMRRYWEKDDEFTEMWMYHDLRSLG